MRELTIAGRRIADDAPAYVCAEISHNHLGSLELAREMIRLAAEAGADAVKFQKRGKATYEGLRAAGEVGYADLRQARELSLYELSCLAAYASGRGIAFLCTAFDVESADVLATVGVDAYKIASGDITNTPLLRHVAGLGKPLLVSTGGCTMADVVEAHRVLTEAGAQFSLLHCTSEYPVEPGNVNLALIETYRTLFPETVIGFSSHVHRMSSCVVETAAFVLGASIFEKHLTITPDIGTGEHAFALTPYDLEGLSQALKMMPRILGHSDKEPLPAEAAGILRLGKHLVYSRALKAGDLLSEDALAVVGGGKGLAPNRLALLVGGVLRRDVAAGEDVREGDVVREPACQSA